jgi:hypothetical protein
MKRIVLPILATNVALFLIYVLLVLFTDSDPIGLIIPPGRTATSSKLPASPVDLQKSAPQSQSPFPSPLYKEGVAHPEAFEESSSLLSEVVKAGIYPGHDSTTIGRAFEAFFSEPTWEDQELANGTKLVVFTGKFKFTQDTVSQNGDQVAGLKAITIGAARYVLFGHDGVKTVQFVFVFSADKSTFRVLKFRVLDNPNLGWNDHTDPATIDWIIGDIYNVK